MLTLKHEDILANLPEYPVNWGDPVRDYLLSIVALQESHYSQYGTFFWRERVNSTYGGGWKGVDFYFDFTPTDLPAYLACWNRIDLYYNSDYVSSSTKGHGYIVIIEFEENKTFFNFAFCPFENNLSCWGTVL